MINFDGYTNENKTEYNSKWPYIPDLTYILNGKTAPTNFIGFKGPLHISKGIYSGDRALEDVEKNKKKLKAELGRIK